MFFHILFKSKYLHLVTSVRRPQDPKQDGDYILGNYKLAHVRAALKGKISIDMLTAENPEIDVELIAIVSSVTKLLIKSVQSVR